MFTFGIIVSACSFFLLLPINPSHHRSDLLIQSLTIGAAHQHCVILWNWSRTTLRPLVKMVNGMLRLWRASHTQYYQPDRTVMLQQQSTIIYTLYVYQMSDICLRACAKMHVPIAEGAIVQTTTETPFSLFYVRHIDWVAIYHLRFIFEQEINKDSQQPSSFRWHSTDLINIVHFSVSVYWRARGACLAHCKRHDKNDLFHPLLFDA